MNAAMTPGEAATLRTILAMGGAVHVSMGRKHARALRVTLTAR